MSEKNDSARSHADQVYSALLARAGEANPRPRIEPVRRLAALCGFPEQSYPVIHVAGTNGKTSTARAIETILRSYGLRTGLLTSPHLISFHERIQIDGEPITDEVLVASWEELQIALGVVDGELEADNQGPITFFEALTVLAYLAFADAPVEVAVVEVGMGGEWDATNIADAKVAVFTPIALEHTSVLGTTHREIARTKAGIIKQHSVVVSAEQHPDALIEIRIKSERQAATLLLAEDDFALAEDRSGVGGRLISVRGLTGATYDAAYLPLFGAHQSANVLLAIAAVEAFFGSEHEIPQQILEDGLANLKSPGRLEPIGNEPTVLVDAAHNPHSAATLAAAIEESFSFDELTLVLGVLGDKHSAGILTALLPLASQVYVTPVHSERSMAADQLAADVAEISAKTPVTVFDSLPDALTEARGWAAESPGRGVLVTGSILLVGEAIQLATAEGWVIAT